MNMFCIPALITFTAFAACNGQSPESHGSENGHPVAILIGDTVSDHGKNIDFIFQDKNNQYWFASNGEGLYRWDGKNILHITEKHGLCSNYVWSIQEDANGNLWFGTRDGICCFDGKRFKDYTTIIRHAPYSPLVVRPGAIFFNHPDGICLFDGDSFTNFTIHPAAYQAESNTTYRPYGVYCTMTDKKGDVWFGTQEKGVCVFDGRSFSFINGKDLDGPAVRCIFQDRNGVFWFGNNGGGLYRYDGKTLANITEERNLGNPEFLKDRRMVDKPGTLARVFAINEDRDGNLWIGTADAGVWKFDGTRLTNYTGQHGLSGNSVTVIYKDKKGDLLFVSNGDAVYRFNGKNFSEFTFQ